MVSKILFTKETDNASSSPKKQQYTGHTGAGVLPYCEKGGEIYFLISKEGHGRAKNTWCDFGGKKDLGETVIKTAAREAWEESRDVLGSQKEIEKQLSSAPSIGSKSYKMFFLKIETPSDITNEKFLKRTFRNHHRMEKTQIEWVKAKDLFKAIKNTNAALLDKRRPVNVEMRLPGSGLLGN